MGTAVIVYNVCAQVSVNQREQAIGRVLPSLKTPRDRHMATDSARSPTRAHLPPPVYPAAQGHGFVNSYLGESVSGIHTRICGVSGCSTSLGCMNHPFLTCASLCRFVILGDYRLMLRTQNPASPFSKANDGASETLNKGISTATSFSFDQLKIGDTEQVSSYDFCFFVVLSNFIRLLYFLRFFFLLLCNM